MALIPALPTLAASSARLSVLPPLVHVRSPSRRRSAILANLSSPPRDGEALDWVEATSSFFEQDTRPIMLFDVRGEVRSPSRRRSAILANLSSPPRGGEALDWVEATSSFFEQDTRPIMLFDGVCNLCNGGVKFVRDNDRQRRIRFEALQSDAGRNLLRRSGRAPDDISSVVLVEKNSSYIKSEAVLKIMEYIDLPFPQLAFFLQFVPLFIRDFVYENIADNRYAVFGRSESCEI